MADVKYEAPEVLRKYFPGGVFKNDLEGRPVFYDPLGQIDFVGLLHSVKAEDIVKYKRKQYEMIVKLSHQQETSLGKTFDNMSTMVLDADGAGRKHLWGPGLDAYKQCVHLYETEFPNLRERIIIINTPVIFPLIFSIIKPFLSEATKNKIKLLGSNWKTEILEFIDKDSIPEFYGGSCKGSRGSSKCEEFICYGGEIPKSYYVSENVDKEEFERVVIKAGTTYTKDIEVKENNTKIKFQFITNNFDIKFSALFKASNEEKCRSIIPEKKFDSQLIMEQGEVECKETGLYTFIFDNGYSWFRGKELYFSIQQLT